MPLCLTVNLVQGETQAREDHNRLLDPSLNGTPHRAPYRGSELLAKTPHLDSMFKLWFPDTASIISKYLMFLFTMRACLLYLEAMTV